jgi:hypothetical protein
MTRPYTIAPDGRSIICHRCGMTSHNRNDVAQRYCGRCHMFLDDEPDLPRLGPCCICGSEDTATWIELLPFKNEVPGHGWGCVACDLPFDGAYAVLCAHCVDDLQAGRKPLRFACRGYPATDGRVPIEQLTIPHEHDMSVEH